MITTPGPRYAPARTEEPPGTTRTRSATPSVWRSGRVSRSKNPEIPPGPATGAVVPARKARRIPSFTHRTARQPWEVRSAARTSPRLKAASSLRTASRAASASGIGSTPVHAAISERSMSIELTTGAPRRRAHLSGERGGRGSSSVGGVGGSGPPSSPSSRAPS